MVTAEPSGVAQRPVLSFAWQGYDMSLVQVRGTELDEGIWAQRRDIACCMGYAGQGLLVSVIV